MSDVSVVIPTTLRSRPQLERAVGSALAQTRPPAEVVVVVDRTDGATFEWDRTDGTDVPVRVVANDGAAGPAGARNAGIRRSAHEYVALLDDDDHWLQRKLEVQRAAIDAVPAAGRAGAIAVCRAWVVDSHGYRACPRDLITEQQTMAAYLFEPSLIRRPARGWFTPAVVAPTGLALDVPFDETLAHWEDVDWMLRALDAPGTRLLYCDEPLVVIDQVRSVVGSQSATASADAIDDWAARVLRPRSMRAFHNFRLTHVTRALVDEGRRTDALRIGRQVLVTGLFDAQSAAEYVALVAMSNRQRRRMRRLRGRLANRRSNASMT